jgi:hypothetical protein
MSGQYKLHKRERSRRRRILFWLLVLLCLAGIIFGSILFVRSKLHPKVIITQAKAVSSTVVFASKTTHYTEPDFSIDLPNTFQEIPRPVGPYQSYTWETSDSGTDGQQVEIFEDTIPTQYAVNRMLVVEGEVDHVSMIGTASDNCSTFTKGTQSAAGGSPAKWQGVDFYCDQGNTERDTIGTSSAEGINTVTLLNQSTGLKHKFFFTYTDHQINPDYTIFYNALTSFKMD